MAERYGLASPSGVNGTYFVDGSNLGSGLQMVHFGRRLGLGRRSAGKVKFIRVF